MLSLARLRTLQEVAHHGGVSAAARELHFTPSAVSQQIGALEAELGAPVLERLGRRVQLTEVGRVLLAHAGPMLRAEAAARAAVESARAVGAVRLTVGVFASVASGLMPALYDELATGAPHVRLATREIDPEHAVRDLHHGHLDLSFLLDYPEAPESWSPGLVLSYVGTDTFSVALPPGDDATAPSALAALADRDWILPGTHSYYGRAVRAACWRAGFEPRVVHQVDEQATALALTAAGLGVTFVSDFGRAFVPPGVPVAPLREPITRRLLLAHTPASAGRPAVALLIEAARAAMARVSADES